MSDSIEMTFKHAAVALADAQSYVEAAAKLGITPSELKQRIEELEVKLCLHLFTPESSPPAPTSEGEFLIKAFREAIRRHERGDR